MACPSSSGPSRSAEIRNKITMFIPPAPNANSYSFQQMTSDGKPYLFFTLKYFSCPILLIECLNLQQPCSILSWHWTTLPCILPWNSGLNHSCAVGEQQPSTDSCRSEYMASNGEAEIRNEYASINNRRSGGWGCESPAPRKGKHHILFFQRVLVGWSTLPFPNSHFALFQKWLMRFNFKQGTTPCLFQAEPFSPRARTRKYLHFHREYPLSQLLPVLHLSSFSSHEDLWNHKQKRNEKHAF